MAHVGPDASKPGWQQRAVGGIASNNRRSKQASLHIDVPYHFKALLALASRKRGISQTGYMRRAVAAFVASDLGIPLEDVLDGMQMPYPANNTRAGWVELDFTPGVGDTGEGYGDWKNLAL
jgi:hypothetical protein